MFGFLKEKKKSFVGHCWKNNLPSGRQVREYAIVLRKMVEDGNSDAQIKEKIDEQMVVIYRIVGICIGIPSEKFTWEYVNKSKEYHSIGPVTPSQFYEKYVKPVFNVDDKVSAARACSILIFVSIKM